MYFIIRDFVNNLFQTIFKAINVVVQDRPPLEVFLAQDTHERQVVADLFEVQDHAAVQTDGGRAVVVVRNRAALILAFGRVEAVDVAYVDHHVDEVGAKLVRFHVDGVRVGCDVEFRHHVHQVALVDVARRLDE